MRLHILGICGTFMGSLAQLAKELGHQVSGSDAGVYPPMSDQLAAAGIALSEGFAPDTIPADTELVIIGNAMSRGNPAVEYVLERGIPYTSGPQWLHDHVLQGRWVLAVAGTHGKTTTSSMLAWILDYAGMQPGFLIGGVPQNFGVSARLGSSPFFVIEADEYDTAFFDKRSKFVHYLPRTLLMNNLEYDHADIFPDLAAIERQFHHLVRLVPANGQIVLPEGEEALERVLKQGLWSSVKRTGASDDADWHWSLKAEDGSAFAFCRNHSEYKIQVNWGLTGVHNVKNAIAAIACAHHVGVAPDIAAQALESFHSVKRRMEKVGEAAGVQVFDDFAHHPTAIATTLDGAHQRLRKQNPDARLFAVLEPRSNTMKLGTHKEELAQSVALADQAFWFQPDNIRWSLAEVAKASARPGLAFTQHDELIAAVVNAVRPGDQVVVMSNGGFANMPRRLVQALEAKA